MPDLRVDQTASAFGTWTNDAGAYTLSLAGAGPVNLDAELTNGRWADLFLDDTGTPFVTDNDSSLVPGTLDFMLNDTPSEFTTAQVNAFYWQTRTHDYFRQYATAFTALDTAVDIQVNHDVVDTINGCNAFYSGDTNFFRNNGTCNNTAFGSVVSHEYGHHIVNQLPQNPSQGAFGEGFSDTVSMLLFDDPIIGRNFSIGGGVVRTPDSANVQYPCSQTASHFCGQILGGAVWEIRKSYVNFYGATPGLELVRQQHANWAMITLGGEGSNSAHPNTAIQWLTLDDNNADIDDGTPNYSRLAAAFAHAALENAVLSVGRIGHGARRIRRARAGRRSGGNRCGPQTERSAP